MRKNVTVNTCVHCGDPVEGNNASCVACKREDGLKADCCQCADCTKAAHCHMDCPLDSECQGCREESF